VKMGSAKHEKGGGVQEGQLIAWLLSLAINGYLPVRGGSYSE